MFCHPLVVQLRFARSEFLRCLDGVSAEDALRHAPAQRDQQIAVPKVIEDA